MAEMDTDIYKPLMQQPPHQGPLDLATKAVALKTAMGRAAAQPLELEQTRLENENLRVKAQNAHEDQQDEQTLQGIYGAVQTDKTVPPEKKLEELRTRAAGKVKPRTLENLSKQIEAHQTAMQKLDDDKLKTLKTVSDEVGNTAAGILSAAPDAQPGLYAQERARMIQSGLATEDHIPEAFDAEWLKAQAAHAMGASNSAEVELRRRTETRLASEEARKARTTELAEAGQTIDAIKDQDSYTAWRNKLSDPVKALTAATWTPANVATIKRIGLTATQQNEADEEAGRLAETAREHDLVAAGKKTPTNYTGDLRAALVATGAKDPDNPSKEEAAKALDRVKPVAGDGKPVPKSTLVAIETRKSAAIAKSKGALDKELAGKMVNGKVIDQAGVDQAWDDHIERLQDAQLGYEHELTTATGNDVGHNDWADKLTAPGKGAAPKAPAAAPAGGAPAQGPDADKVAKAKQLASKYNEGDIVTIRGQKVRITKLNKATGNFTPEPVQK